MELGPTATAAASAAEVSISAGIISNDAVAKLASADWRIRWKARAPWMFNFFDPFLGVKLAFLYHWKSPAATIADGESSAIGWSRYQRIFRFWPLTVQFVWLLQWAFTCWNSAFFSINCLVWLLLSNVAWLTVLVVVDHTCSTVWDKIQCAQPPGVTGLVGKQQ